MKKIDTLIQPAVWDEAHAALETLGARVTVREVRTFGPSTSTLSSSCGSAYFLNLAPQLELSVLVEDALVESTIVALETIVREGEIVVSAVDGIVHRGERRTPTATGATIAPLARPSGSVALRPLAARG